jgi:hypothetical protein
MLFVATSRLAVAGVLFATVACTSGRPASAGPAPRQGASVQVTNMSWLDVVVYSVGAGPRWRLGTVGSMDTETFRLPQHNVGSASLRLMADPIGSREIFVSERIGVSPGQRVDFTVTPVLTHSYHALRW